MDAAAQFLASVIAQTTPLLLAALAAMITTRANILNVAVEGMMLVSAFTAIAVGQATGEAGLALGCAVLASLATALLFGFVAIVLRADFILAGLGLNILAAGGTLFVLEKVYQDPGGLRPSTFPDLWQVPAGALGWLPVLGPAFEGQSVIVLLAIAAVPACAFLLGRTPLGYGLRAVGEDAAAAAASGIRVDRMKLVAVLISGLLAWLAGAQLSMDRLHFFLPGMTSGRGFIGLAATLFGGGQPWATAGASVLFGVFGALGDRLQSLQVPSQFVLMIPYAAAIAGLVVSRLRALNRRAAPAEDQPR